jgi:DNA-binding beta-propeller fold protein YncE
MTPHLRWVCFAMTVTACRHPPPPALDAGATGAVQHVDAGAEGAPLAALGDVGLPGHATRFDYQDVDAARGHLVIAHMGDSEVVVVNLSDGATVGRVPGIDTVRGVIVATDRIFATAKNGELVTIDATTLKETGRQKTGQAPDGVAWDSVDDIVATSDQRDGALSLFLLGKRTVVPLGTETGNVVFDEPRRLFWVTVVPDQLVSVEPETGAVKQRIDLPGCRGAHGLRLHPDGQSAFIACEENDLMVRVTLATGALTPGPVGKDPDVLAIDPGLMRLYVAAESGDLTVFDLARPGLHEVARAHIADAAHSVAVDPATHRLFFPLKDGPKLRIMKPQ